MQGGQPRALREAVMRCTLLHLLKILSANFPPKFKVLRLSFNFCRQPAELKRLPQKDEWPTSWNMLLDLANQRMIRRILFSRA